jgi:hypothetical protein
MTHLPVTSTFYDGMFVPEHRLLGQEGQGLGPDPRVDRDRFGGIAYAHFHPLERLAAWAKEIERRALRETPWVPSASVSWRSVEGSRLLQDVAA